MARRSKTKPERKKRATPKRKHVKVAAGQELHVHVLNARGKEIGCQVAQADKVGAVTLLAPPEPTAPPTVEDPVAPASTAAPAQ